MYHGKKHKFVSQDIQNNQLIKAKSGKNLGFLQLFYYVVPVQCKKGDTKTCLALS